MELFVRNLIVPLIRRRGWTAICEIGASKGQSTDILVSLPQASVTVIDPCFDCDLAQKYAGDARVVVHKKNSLEALPALEGQFDCILIDGDHNWYTVSHELGLIHQRRLLRRGGMIFLHDVDWPYGRRDMYYQPETIPAEYRHEYRDGGIIEGQGELSDRGGSHVKFNNAVREGGKRNGVLTAVEDFVSDHRRDYQFAMVYGDAGLGVLHFGGGLRSKLDFFAFSLSASAKNAVTRSKRFARVHFPAFYSSAKAILGRG